MRKYVLVTPPTGKPHIHNTLSSLTNKTMCGRIIKESWLHSAIMTRREVLSKDTCKRCENSLRKERS